MKFTGVRRYDMAASLKLTSRDGIDEIESKMLQCQGTLRKLRRDLDVLLARTGPTFFGDIWAATAIATCVPDARESRIIALGMQDWEDPANYGRFGSTPAALVAIQLGVPIVTDNEARKALDPELVRRQVLLRGGVYAEGAHSHGIVELDPQLPTSFPLASAGSRTAALKEFLLASFRTMEVNARGNSSDAVGESGEKLALVQWLNELHTNAFEHGRVNNGMRLLRIEKHQAPRLSVLLKHADGNKPLQEYLKAQVGNQARGPFNFVEATVSDFGPGILDAFSASFAGKGLAGSHERADLLLRVLHEQLSSKSGEPSAGLGIQHALRAAWSLDAFVSLRTAEFALTMRGQLNGLPILTLREGNRARVKGTHWQLLLPDRKMRD